MNDGWSQDNRGKHDGEDFRWRRWEVYFQADGVLAAMTPATSIVDADGVTRYSDIPPENARLMDAIGQILTTFSGNAIGSLKVGDAGDDDRFGSTSTMTAGTVIKNRTATANLVPSGSQYAPLLTGDQIPTAGKAKVTYFGYEYVAGRSFA